MNFIKKYFSLKIRIIIFFFGIVVLMVCSYTFVGRRFVSRFTEERLNDDYNRLLAETCDTIEKLQWNLTLTSQQLIGNADIQDQLMDYITTDNKYAKLNVYDELLDTIYTLTLSNTDIALIYFYNENNEDYLYHSLPVDAKLDTYPVMYQDAAFCFQGPCQSQSSFISNPVLVLNRTESLPNGAIITLSLESGYYSLSKPFQNVAYKSAYLLFTNTDGDMLYNTLPSSFDSKDIQHILTDNSNLNYHIFSQKSSQGWFAHIIIPDSAYTKDFSLAVREFVICTILIFIMVGIMTFYFWKSIWHPLRLFDTQLNFLLSDDIPADRVQSSIPEYNHIMQKITVLQKQIREMIETIIKQEKLHSKIQLEKLRSQINPHFLLNTLNTLHWMALMNNQVEIDKITQSLSHLLSYNLDKQSSSSNLQNEIAALQEYITLQQVRYIFNFEVHAFPHETTLNYPCPKFLLQPLVENSLTHGYREHMDIILEVYVYSDIEIKICDTGAGMSPDKLQELKNLTNIKSSSNIDDHSIETPKPIHYGIGLQYVVQSLNDFYNGNYHFDISSIYDQRTSIVLTVPKLGGGGYYAENPYN